MMIPNGIKASELVKLLAERIRLYGDRPCFAGGNDYPEGIHTVTYKRESTPYVPANSFYLG